MFEEVAQQSRLYERSDADWLSCNESDYALDGISQQETSRRDYHTINIKGLVAQTTREHSRRSLFHAWDYSDPLPGTSLHLEPREDRRHANQWHMPSSNPTRKVTGGMMGANRLALEAWPLFQSLPQGEKLGTVGFDGTHANTIRFTLPIWMTPLTLAVVPSVLALEQLQRSMVAGSELRPLGILIVFRCSRILVNKTPNLTAPVALARAGFKTALN